MRVDCIQTKVADLQSRVLYGKILGRDGLAELCGLVEELAIRIDTLTEKPKAENKKGKR